MEKERPLPWRAFIGCALTMLSLFIAFALNITIFGQSIKAANPYLPPYGRELLQPLANLMALVLLIVGIFLMYSGFKETESKTKSQ